MSPTLADPEECKPHHQVVDRPQRVARGIDRHSVNVRCAVLEFGGNFGMGVDRHPLLLGLLKCDIEKEGYVAPLEKEQLSNAPYFSNKLRPACDEAYDRRMHEHYGTPWL